MNTSLRAPFLLSAVLVAGCGGDGAINPLAPPEGAPVDASAVNMRLLGWLDLRTLTAGGSGGALPRGAGNWGYTAPNGRRFALTGTSYGLSVDEVTLPHHPRHVTLIPGPESPWREVKTYRDLAYVSTEANHGMDIVDLRDPDRPVKLSTYNATFTSAHTICIDEARGFLFANGTRNASRQTTGMRVLSLENPTVPREVGSFTSFYIHDCVVRGQTLFASAINSGFQAALDISNPANVREIARWTTGGRFTHNAWPTEDGRFLFTTDEVTNAPVETWNITDLSRPTRVSQYLGKPGTVAHNVFVFGKRLLIAHYTDGVHLLDVNDPTQPRLLGKYDTLPSERAGVVFDGVWGAYMFPGSDIIVASDMSGGLFVLEYTGS